MTAAAPIRSDRVGMLTHRERQALLLKAHGWPVPLIALALGLAVGTIKQHLHMAHVRVGEEHWKPTLEALRRTPLPAEFQAVQPHRPRPPVRPAETPQGALARSLFNAAFDRLRAPTSREYQQGALEMLIARTNRTAIAACPFPIAGARADAWFAGTREGAQIWRAHVEALEAAAEREEMLEAKHA